MNGINVPEASNEVDSQAPILGRRVGAFKLRLQKEVVRTLSGTDLELVAGGICNGPSVSAATSCGATCNNTNPGGSGGTTKGAGASASYASAK